MEIQILTEKIKSLDPIAHKALREALAAKYSHLIGERGEAEPQSESTLDPFAEMFEKAVDEINRRYIEGADDYIRKFQPGLYKKTNEAEDRINEVWKAGLEGKVGIEEFRQVLGQWFRLHLRSIEIYSREHKKEEAQQSEKQKRNICN